MDPVRKACEEEFLRWLEGQPQLLALVERVSDVASRGEVLEQLMASWLAGR